MHDGIFFSRIIKYEHLLAYNFTTLVPRSDIKITSRD